MQTPVLACELAALPILTPVREPARESITLAPTANVAVRVFGGIMDHGDIVMAIPATVSNYLTKQGFDYHVVPHPYTKTSADTAREAHVEPDKIAKAVVVATVDGDRRYRLAVLPASTEIDVGELSDVLGETVELAEERELTELFPDCALGAVPVLGSAYGLQTVVDSSLNVHDDVYFEAGDHQELIRISGEHFQRLMESGGRGSFSYPATRDEFRR